MYNKSKGIIFKVGDKIKDLNSSVYEIVELIKYDNFNKGNSDADMGVKLKRIYKSEKTSTSHSIQVVSDLFLQNFIYEKKAFLNESN